jgi:hypothetical protein
LTTDWRIHYQTLWKPEPMTTPRDGMTLAQFTAARDALRDALVKFEQASPTCARCAHFEMGDCKHFGVTPPPEFQKTPEACEAWVYDGVPFASADFSHDVATSKQRRMRGYDF